MNIDKIKMFAIAIAIAIWTCKTIDSAKDLAN